MERVSFVIEIADIVTDFLFAINLIMDQETENAELFGWLSAIPTVFGGVMSYLKLNLTRKFIGYQCVGFKQRLSEIHADANKEEECKRVIGEIRNRVMDLNVFGLLGVCVE